nr:hypothetical protein [Bacillus licheniformis]
MLNLTKEELESLLRFRLGTKQTGSLFSVKGNMLLDEDFLGRYAEAIKDRLNAPNQKVAASMLVKRGGMLAAAAFLSVYGLRKTAPSRPGFRIVGDRSG